MRTKQDITEREWIIFNIYIDKLSITNKLIYESILQDFLNSNRSIESFIRNPVVIP